MVFSVGHDTELHLSIYFSTWNVNFNQIKLIMYYNVQATRLIYIHELLEQRWCIVIDTTDIVKFQIVGQKLEG